ncbi:hypothetical protein, variant 1 [Aphanomyces invadans]|uniref:AP-5 complex subunit beta-1 n=1 Tax=Aphanomyces invadans TaxID=157072 RepID=A0A024UC71_9STRA|nr:hypothetical protein, variant 1 [Aphanomyces invadans]ETW03467.1 hypothetical protein, variant 1 [Aphanomyces invadans]|eukprot:XP_008867696.1 hypothetical protein, variant 1 [Aphanomyces invadans]
MMETKPTETDATKVQQRATKHVQTATTKKHALTRTEVFNVLQECFSPETTTQCKILGFRLAGLAPSCITTEVWQLILDAAVKELAGAAAQGTALVLLHSIPVFDVLPLTLTLGFLQQQDLEPLKKIQAIFSHESVDVRCVALATFCRVSINCTKVLFARGLTRFPFESNEARIVAQQDVTSILTDIWKLTLQAAEVESPEVAAVAFASLSHLFSRSHAIRSLSSHHPRQESGLDELVAWIFPQAFPRFDVLKANAQTLPTESHLHAMKWLSMVAYMMMQKSGACTPGIAIAMMELDAVALEDQDAKTTVKVRADLVAADMVESWCLPAYVNASLTQAFSICEAIAIVMQHPLQHYNQWKWSSVLITRLTAIIHSSTMARQRQDVIRIQLLLLDATNTFDFANVVGSTIDSIAALDNVTTRVGLMYDLCQAMLVRVCRKRQFPLLQSICTSSCFHGLPLGQAKGKTNAAYETFRSLVEALLFCTHANVPHARLVVLQQFVAVLANKSTTDLRNATLVLFTALLTQLCQDSCAAPPVLDFLHNVVLPLAPKVPSANVRVQLYWLGLKFVSSTQLPIMSWVETELLGLLSSKDGSGRPSTTYDDGILGGGTKNVRTVDAHLIPRFNALLLCLRWLLAKDGSLKQRAVQVLAHVRTQNNFHRFVSDTAVETIEEITGMARRERFGFSSAFVLPGLFSPASLFPSRSMDMPQQAPVKWKEEVETVVSGSCDPLCLKISYREPDDHPEEIALCVTCCNVTNVPWSDFSIGVGVKGAVKLVDTSNNMHIRATGEVKPHGMFKSEKLFRFLRFSRAEFLFRLVVEPSSPEMPPTSMGLSNPYYIPFDAMFTLPDPTLWTAPYFQASWQSADANKIYKIQATQGKKMVPNHHVKVAFVADASMDTPFLVHMSFVTWTKWNECVCATISCCLDTTSRVWKGSLEVRSTHGVVDEVDKAPRDLLDVLVPSTTFDLIEDNIVERPVACVSPRHRTFCLILSCARRGLLHQHSIVSSCETT